MIELIILSGNQVSGENNHLRLLSLWQINYQIAFKMEMTHFQTKNEINRLPMRF